MEGNYHAVNGQNIYIRKVIVWIVVALIVLISVFVVQPVILQGAHTINLKSAPDLTGQISQALTSSAAPSKLPVVGPDYTLQNTNYFENKGWAVTTIVPGGANQRNIVVLKQTQGIYQVVLGPGTAFPSGYTSSLPTSVAGYLIQNGVIYDPVE